MPIHARSSLHRSHTQLIEEVSRNLRPAQRIQQTADAIVSKLTADGAVYNGVHLRAEADAEFKNYYGLTDEVRAPSRVQLGRDIQDQGQYRGNPASFLLVAP